MDKYRASGACLLISSILISGCAGNKYAVKDNVENTALITFNNLDRRSSITVCQKDNWGNPKGYRGPEVDDEKRRMYKHKTIKVSTEEPVFINYKVIVDASRNQYCQAPLYLKLTPGRHYNLAILTRTSKSSLPDWLQTALLMTPSIKSCYVGIGKENLFSSDIFYTPAVKPVRNSSIGCKSVVSGVPDILKLTAFDVDEWVDNVMPKYKGTYRVASYAVTERPGNRKGGYNEFKADYKGCFESMGGDAKSLSGKDGQFDLLKCMLLKKNDDNQELKWKLVK